MNLVKTITNIPKSIASAFKKMSNTQKIVLLLVIVAIIAVCYLYRTQISDFFVGLKNKITGTESYEEVTDESIETNNNNEEGFSNKLTDSTKQLVLFYAPWCPHCKTMMPDWDKFAAENKSSVKAKKVNSDEDPETVKEYEVQGFPTILLLDSNGKKIADYQGERNTKAFAEFVKAQ
jgi:protein disulfide-isomerase-like protein